MQLMEKVDDNKQEEDNMFIKNEEADKKEKENDDKEEQQDNSLEKSAWRQEGEGEATKFFGFLNFFYINFLLPYIVTGRFA